MWLDPVFEVKYPCFPTTCVKDPGCWSHDCLVSMTTSPTHCDVPKANWDTAT